MQGVLGYLADLLLMTGSLGAAAYCMVLSRRLTRLGSFDKGIGSAIAVLSAQVEEMKAALSEVKAGSDGAGQQLNDLVGQAREISAELEMMIAACHDFAETAIDVQTGPVHPQMAEETAEQVADRDMTAEANAARPSQAQREMDEGSELLAQASEPGGADTPDGETPVFGSRRAAQHAAEDAAVPVFRRATAGG